eukprot:TRINITY_DN1057_c0_g1_i1.p1 TRINITY_DN1057_c0_g1~~TRINITY_DN1057_c0_g1_i1.p1  ORF type:complete len:628 (+),score=107.83 TRINITY_DN1057_c0_g1_i1:105-1988(+)
MSDASSTFEETHRRLQELERLIAQVCPRSDSSGSTQNQGQISAHRPSSARPTSGNDRPQNGNARPQAARPQPGNPRPQSAGNDRPQNGNARPQTARPQAGNARPQSARAARPQSASSTASLQRPQTARPPVNQAEQAAAHRKKQQEFQNLLDLVGHKAAAKFKTIHACFRTVDSDHNGTVDHEELVALFRSFNLQEEFADRFMEHMDPQHTGEIEYTELQQIIGQYIQPGYKASKERRVAVRADACKTMEQRKREAELKQLAEIIGAKAHAKYRCLRDCFRFVDEDKDGTVSRAECVRFMEVFGFPHSVGDHVYDLLLDKTGHSGEVDFTTFLGTFGPYIQPGYAVQLMQAHEKQVHDRGDGPGPYATRQAANRPQSARAHHRQATGAAAERHRPASADSRKGDDCASTASTMSGSASSKAVSSASSSVASSAGRQFRRMVYGRPQRQQSGARPNQVAAPKNSRSANWSKNSDSSNLRNRVYYQGDEGAQPSSMSRLSHHGPVFKTVEGDTAQQLEMEDPHAHRQQQAALQPRRPSHSPGRPRPQSGRARAWRAPTPPHRHHRSVEVPATKCMLGEDSLSTCEPGTPREQRLKHRAASASRLQKESKMSASTASLCSSLEQQWSVIA